MARIDDLVAQITDRTLRQRIEAALADMKRRQRFGLVYEEHVPETATLLNYPVHMGATVQRRSDVDAGKLYQVTAIDEAVTTLRSEEDGIEWPAPIGWSGFSVSA